MKKQAEEDIDITDKDEKRNDVQNVESKLPLTTDISNLQSGPVTIHAASSLGPISSRTAALQFSATSIKSQSAPPYAESSSKARFSIARSNQNNHKDALQLRGVPLVAQFLNTCLPPMAHLLKHFVDFGCISEEYLAAVSTWPANKILSFLDQVSERAGDENLISDMDKLVLQDHFSSYFNKANDV